MTPEITLWGLVDLYADALKADAALQSALEARYGNAPKMRRAVHPKVLPVPTPEQPYLVVAPLEAEEGAEQAQWPFKVLVAVVVCDEATAGDDDDLTYEGVEFLTNTAARLLLNCLANADPDAVPGAAKLFLDMDTAPKLACGYELTITVPNTLNVGVTIGG